jgi:hypothetical protein
MMRSLIGEEYKLDGPAQRDLSEVFKTGRIVKNPRGVRRKVTNVKERTTWEEVKYEGKKRMGEQRSALCPSLLLDMFSSFISVE